MYTYPALRQDYVCTAVCRIQNAVQNPRQIRNLSLRTGA